MTSGGGGAARVLVLSDSHLSERTPEATSNWAACADVADSFDLVVHIGDLTLNGAESDRDLEFARRTLDELPVPWFVVPGNHDVGNNPGAVDGPPVDEMRLGRWRERVGPDYWSIELADWTVVGLDCQLFESGLADETAQWSWIEERLSEQPPGRPLALLTHKPLTAPAEELATAPGERFVRASARERIGTMLRSVDCPLVLSGHVHQFRNVYQGDRRHVWVPTTWAVLPERIQRTIGLKRCGAVSAELWSDGSGSVTLIEPPGLVQQTLSEDVANPYHR